MKVAFLYCFFNLTASWASDCPCNQNKEPKFQHTPHLQYEYGECLINQSDDNCPPDSLKLGQNAILKAAQANDPLAIMAYANFAALGVGRSQNIAEAIDWWKKAAQLEVSAAMIQLGQCFEQGVGVKQDKKTAKQWYEKALKKGDPRAKKMLDQMVSK